MKGKRAKRPPNLRRAVGLIRRRLCLVFPLALVNPPCRGAEKVKEKRRLLPSPTQVGMAEVTDKNRTKGYFYAPRLLPKQQNSRPLSTTVARVTLDRVAM